MTSPLEILELSLIPGSSPAVYGVGLAAVRITIADQQKRAINLIWALLREDRLIAGQRIAIVGAGVAGVTAAAYAVTVGLKVTLFDRYDEPFALQQGSSRWIHPNIYSWPDDGWQLPRTDLPCMNWSAGTAGQVVARLRQEYDVLSQSPAFSWKGSTEIVGIEPAPSREALIVSKGGDRHGPFAALIFALGFGEDVPRAEIGGKAYWRDDDLHQRVRTGATVLVSGCGDGGLIDAFRILMRDYRHESLAHVAAAASAVPPLVAQLQRIERDTTAHRDGAELTAATLAVDVPATISSLITARVRPNTRVIMNSRADGPLTRKASLLNRFVTAQLIKAGVVTFQHGSIALPSLKEQGTVFTVEIDSVAHTYDFIVLRHGPARTPLSAFSTLDSRLSPIRTFLQTYSVGLDKTRSRSWGPLPPRSPELAASLPPLAGAAADYFSERIREALHQELLLLDVDALVDYNCAAELITFQVTVAGQTHAILIDNRQPETLDLSGPAGPHTMRVSLLRPLAEDPHGASQLLIQRLPDVLGWIVRG